jgi:peroxiredoxin
MKRATAIFSIFGFALVVLADPQSGQFATNVVANNNLAGQTNFSAEVAAVTASLKEKFDTGKITEADLAENLEAINDLIVKHLKDGDREQLARLYLLAANIYVDGLKDTDKARAVWAQVVRSFPGTQAAQGAQLSLARLNAEDAAKPVVRVSEAGNPQIGWLAPNFAAQDINGKTVRFSDYKGKIVVLESYRKECLFCLAHYRSGAMQDLQREMTTNGVVWLIIDFPNTASGSEWHGWPEPPDVRKTPAQAKQEWADQNMAVTDWIIDWDGSNWGTQVGRTYAMRTVPETFVINRDGKLAYQGAIDTFEEMYEANPAAFVINQGAIDDFLGQLHQKMQVTYAGRQMPVPFLDDRDRALLSWDPRPARNYLREAVRALLDGKKVPVPETKPYGCGLGIMYH